MIRMKGGVHGNVSQKWDGGEQMQRGQSDTVDESSGATVWIEGVKMLRAEQRGE